MIAPEITKTGSCDPVFRGQRWIRTTEASCSRFTVCPLWPLGNLPIPSRHCLNTSKVYHIHFIYTSPNSTHFHSTHFHSLSHQLQRHSKSIRKAINQRPIAAPPPLPCRESNSTKIVEILSTIPTVIRLCLLLALTLHARLSAAERLHSNFLVLLSGRFCEVDIRACPSKLAFYVFYMATRLAQTDEGHAHISQNPPARRTQKFSNCKSFCREQPDRSAQTFKRHN